MIKGSREAPTRSSPHPAGPPAATGYVPQRLPGRRWAERGGGQRRHLGRGEERRKGRGEGRRESRAGGGAEGREGRCEPPPRCGEHGGGGGEAGDAAAPGERRKKGKKARKGNWGRGGKRGAGPRTTWKSRRRRRVRKLPPRLPPLPPTRAARPGIFVGAGAGRLLTMLAGGCQTSSPAAESAEPRSGCRARTLGAAAAAGPAARSAPSLRQWLLALTRNGAQRARAGAGAALTLGGGGGASHIRAPAAPRAALAKEAERGRGVCGGRGRRGAEENGGGAEGVCWLGGCAAAVASSSSGIFAASPCAILLSCGVCYISLIAGALASFF